jgi:serine protease
VVEAVIDSGVVSNDPELATVLLPGYDMVAAPANGRGGRSTNSTPDDLGSGCEGGTGQNALKMHGTEVSRLLLANSPADAKAQYAGIAIVPVRVHNGCRIVRRDMLDAMAWAAGFHVDGQPDNENSARIINLSLAGGGRICGPDLQAMIQKLTARNIFVVVAAGDSFHKTLREPANCEGVIAVGAVDSDNRIADYSALDPRIDVYAYGGERLSSHRAANRDAQSQSYDLAGFGNGKFGNYGVCVGTSFATPIVAGIWRVGLRITPVNLCQRLRPSLATQPWHCPRRRTVLIAWPGRW